MEHKGSLGNVEFDGYMKNFNNLVLNYFPSKKVTNLYYCGHYTHPGIGVPVTLISSQLATQKIVDSLK